MNTLMHFIKNEGGNGTISYCMLTGVITAAISEPLELIGQRLSIVFMTIANALTVH